MTAEKYRVLCDEHVEKQAARHLRKLGHDVERVVDVHELGPSSSDEEIAEYASGNDQLVLTADDDFLTLDPSTHAGILFVPTDRFDPFTIASIVDAASEHVSQNAVDPSLYCTRDWL